MSNPLSRLQSRLALHSHLPTAPPIIIHTTQTPGHFATDDARRIRWALRLKDSDWYECVGSTAVDTLVGSSPASTGKPHDRRAWTGDQPAVQIGRDVYWGVAAALRGIERRCGHPTLFPCGRGTGKEDMTNALRRWADTSFRTALAPLLSALPSEHQQHRKDGVSPSSPSASHSAPQSHHQLHAHLATIEALLAASTPSKSIQDANPDRRISVADGVAGQEAITTTKWHGIHASAPYPHATDICLASTVYTLRNNVPSFRRDFTAGYPLTAAWVDRVVAYLSGPEDGTHVSSQDCLDVLGNDYSVGQVGAGPPGKTDVTVGLATGEELSGSLEVVAANDLTLACSVVVPGSKPVRTVTCSVTVAREDVVAETRARSKSIRYVD
ncbi:hypothetical protein HKX48_003911 [Thoreauomyces humboldtii]|nr:hypothetical protein HKX48_003911 [Thoreauomyces humboldtii]